MPRRPYIHILFKNKMPLQTLFIPWWTGQFKSCWRQLHPHFVPATSRARGPSDYTALQPQQGCMLHPPPPHTTAVCSTQPTHTAVSSTTHSCMLHKQPTYTATCSTQPTQLHDNPLTHSCMLHKTNTGGTNAVKMGKYKFYTLLPSIYTGTAVFQNTKCTLS